MKVAIYTRLSEADQDKQYETDDSISIQNQKIMLTNYAKERGWEIYRIYNDEDYCGADRNRPAFRQLLIDAQSRAFDIILCKSQSRFTRELELVEKYIHGLFPVWGIRFISIVDNADTDNKGNKKSRQINGLVNEWYLEDMSDSIKSALTVRRKEGCHIGSFALYGYKKDPEQKGHLIIDEGAAAIVREVFTLFSRGYGKTKIAQILNERGIPNPTEYKRRQGLRYKMHAGKNSTLWKYAAIAYMLKNEMYIGTMVQGKAESISYKTQVIKPRPKDEWYIVEGTHEAIIERELWDKVQRLLKERARPFEGGKVGLFAHKARCANCGYTMASTKTGDRRYLQCSNRHVSKGACIGAFIPQKELERAVLGEIQTMIHRYFDMETAKEQLQFSQDHQNKIDSMRNRLKAAEMKREELNRALQNLYIDKTKGILSERDYIDFSQSFSEERSQCDMMIAAVRKELDYYAEHAKDPHHQEEKREILKNYININELNRDIINMLIDYIEIGKRDKQTKQVPIQIYWNF